MGNPKIDIIIPCYNEHGRLPILSFTSFLTAHPNAHICFVDDASTDESLKMLQSLQQQFVHQITVISNPVNSGKAAAVRMGVLHCCDQNTAPVLAYLDADLAVSLEECYSFLFALDYGKKFVFASRILKIGSVIERKFSRFVFGRIIATVISNILDVKVYDTQCGCKVFQKELGLLLFQEPFISKWLFDVELFSRILCEYGKENALQIMDEIPVKQWIDKGGSKVKLSYFFRLWYDLFLIRKRHKVNYNYSNP